MPRPLGVRLLSKKTLSELGQYMKKTPIFFQEYASQHPKPAVISVQDLTTTKMVHFLDFQKVLWTPDPPLPLMS